MQHKKEKKKAVHINTPVSGSLELVANNLRSFATNVSAKKLY
jgi:hypothetical protein